MYSLITPDVRHKYEDRLDQMFRARYDQFITQMGWDVPGVEAPYEKDAFDTEDTVYIIVVDPVLDTVTASARLNPTTKPHLLTEIFQNFCDLQAAPQADDVWEWSRQQVASHLYPDRVEELRMRMQVSLGKIQFCQANGIRKLSTITHARAYNLLQRVYTTEPLGLPHRESGEDEAWIASVVTLDEASIAKVRERAENPEKVIAQIMAFNSAKSFKAA